jgi:hypothetical protein
VLAQEEQVTDIAELSYGHLLAVAYKTGRRVLLWDLSIGLVKITVPVSKEPHTMRFMASYQALLMAGQEF